MSKSSALILLGVLTILTPFSGLPVAVRTLLFIVFGACVLGIGFLLRPREQRAQVAAQGASAPEAPAPVVEAREPLSEEPPAPAEPSHGVSPI